MLSTAPIRAYIPASNVARARKFYEHTVGLTPKEDYAGGVIYDCGGTEVSEQHRGWRWCQDGVVQGYRGEYPGHQRTPLRLCNETSEVAIGGREEALLISAPSTAVPRSDAETAASRR
jgi:hypothetical protein